MPYDIDINSPIFEGTSPRGVRLKANVWLALIRRAWEQGCPAMEALADGFGEGEGTHGDWSGIRDSSPEAVAKMASAAIDWHGVV